MKILLAIIMIVCLAGCSKESRRDGLLEDARENMAKEKYTEARLNARNAIKLDPNASEAYLIIGRTFFKEQDYSQAYSNYLRANEIAPDNVEVLSELGKIALFANDVAKAAEFLEKARTLAPENLDVLLLHSALLVKKGQVEEARTILSGLLKQFPDNEDVVLALASAHISAKEFGTAKSLLRTRLESKPGSAAILQVLINVALAEKEYGAAKDYLLKLQETHKDSENIPLQIASIYVLEGKVAESAAHLEKHLRANPNAGRVRQQLVTMYVERNELAKAMAVLDSAPEKTPEMVLRKAGLLVAESRFQDAMDILRPLVTDKKAGSAGAKAQYAIAECLTLMGKPEEALAELNDLIRRNPGDMGAHAMRGKILMAQGKFDEAVSDFRTLTTELPESIEHFISLAEAFNAQGNTFNCEETLLDIRRRFPSDPRAYVALGVFKYRLGKIDEALQIMAQGRAKSDNPKEMLLLEADMLERANRLPDAIALLQSFDAKTAVDQEIGLKLAALYFAMKNYEEAASYYSLVLTFTPDSGVAAFGKARSQVLAGHAEAALDFAMQRMESRPDDVQAVLIAGEVASLAGREEKAEDFFLKAFAMAPAHPQVMVRLAQFYAATNRLEKGIATFRQKKAENPKAFAPAMITALLLDKAKRTQEAEQAYNDALAIDQGAVLAANNLAYLIASNAPTPERLQKAASLAAMAAKTEIPAFLDTLGWIYVLQEKTTEALPLFRKAHKAAPEDMTIAYHLAYALIALDHKEEGQALARQIVAVESDFPEKSKAAALLEK